MNSFDPNLQHDVDRSQPEGAPVSLEHEAIERRLGAVCDDERIDRRSILPHYFTLEKAE